MRKQLEPDFSEETYINGESTSNFDMSIRRLRLLITDLISEVESLERVGSKATEQSGPLERGESINLSEEITQFEIALIKGALYRTGGHPDRAAALLNLNSSTLKAKISQYNIRVDFCYLSTPRRAIAH
jgi:DNA-binding NtrC family response regulator